MVGHLFVTQYSWLLCCIGLLSSLHVFYPYIRPFWYHIWVQRWRMRNSVCGYTRTWKWRLLLNATQFHAYMLIFKYKWPYDWSLYYGLKYAKLHRLISVFRNIIRERCPQILARPFRTQWYGHRHLRKHDQFWTIKWIVMRREVLCGILITSHRWVWSLYVRSSYRWKHHRKIVIWLQLMPFMFCVCTALNACAMFYTKWTISGQLRPLKVCLDLSSLL